MDKAKIFFILVAGFSSDNREILGLKESLEKLGFNAYAISFYGEGYRDDFSSLKISDCIANITGVINRYAGQYENVFGIGLSLGGALLLDYAKTHEELKGIASIGTPFKLKNKKWINFGQKFLPIINLFWKWMQKIKSWRLSPLGVVNVVMEYLGKELPENLASIKTPVLFLHSKEDEISEYKVLPKYLALLSSKKKKIQFFDNGNHVIDHNPDLVIKYILDFFDLRD